MANYTLYYTPGACSLSPNIVLREAGLPFEPARVDLRTKQVAGGGDWLPINPKGYVPMLRLPDGQMLGEGAVMIQYLADQVPEKRLAPANGTFERVRMQELLHFIATELHKGMSPLYNALAGDAYKDQVKQRLGGKWALLAEQLRGKQYLFGDTFTIADAYAFYVLRAWLRAHKQDLARWPELADYYARLSTRPSVADALAAEGLAA